MTVFATAEELYSLIGKAFSDFLTGEDAAPFRAVDAIVRFEFKEPEAQITLVLQEAATAVEFGSSARDANATASLTGDLAHQVMVEEQALAEAVGRRDITFSLDDPWLLIRVGSLPEAARATYIQLLEAAGRPDLIPQDKPVFGSEDEIYESLGRALRSFAANDPAAARYLTLKTVARIETKEPAATLTIDLTSSDFKVETGPSAEPAEVGLSIDGNSLDRLFRGDLQATAAVGRGLLAYSGDTWKALELLALPHEVASYYKDAAPIAADRNKPNV